MFRRAPRTRHDLQQPIDPRLIFPRVVEHVSDRSISGRSSGEICLLKLDENTRMAATPALPCLSLSHAIRDAVSLINAARKGIVLITNSEGRIIGTVTDGDIRRAMLSGIQIDQSLDELQRVREDAPQKPVTAPLGTPREQLIRLMQQHQIQQIPLLDSDGLPAELWTLSDLQPSAPRELQALIMAGGFGKRLRPLTDEIPKPMLPIGGRPLMEHAIEQLRTAGVERVNISTFYKPEKIVDHFRDGSDFGVDIQYITEEQPLGTAGALRLLERPNELLLVLNGDVLTAIDYKALLDYHGDNGAALTVAVRRYEVNVPYGVIESDGIAVQRLVEKPSFHFFVNAGIYLVNPECLEHIPLNQRFDMTELIERLMTHKMPVIGFPIHEYWLDIGQHEDYQQAQQDIRGDRLKRAA